MRNSRLFAYVGFLSALISLGDFIIRLLQKTEDMLSPITIGGLVVFAIAMILYAIISDKETYYNIKKRVCYYMHNKDAYSIETKESIYIYKSRTEMEHNKKHCIVSNVNNLKHFYDKFKWSKEQKTEDIDIISNNPRHKVSVKRVENWHQYMVEFDELGKGESQSINVTIKNLKDPNMETVPFLSSNIICRTRKLKLVVQFEDANIKPINIKYKIYDNYASTSPLLQYDCNYNETERKIEKVEDFPLYGYRYLISWEFDN